MRERSDRWLNAIVTVSVMGALLVVVDLYHSFFTGGPWLIEVLHPLVRAFLVMLSAGILGTFLGYALRSAKARWSG